MFDLQKKGPSMYELPKTEGMHVPGLIIATEKLLQEKDIERPLEQVKNVAYLPGIVGYSIAMPDIHWGYGFPIGGVAAMDLEEGVISPGGVGYDINCGVRLALIPEMFDHLSEETKENLLKSIFRRIPSGIGSERKQTKPLSDSDYKNIAEKGARWSVEQGYGFLEDLEHIESNGCISGANIESVSSHAKERGKKQLGSVGSGNHFIEIGKVQKIFLPKIAASWNILEGQMYVLIHSGSRGFGHQICQDTLNDFIKKGFARDLPDKQLVAAPLRSVHAKKYFEAMASAANFAFNNRQQMLHLVRISVEEILNINKEKVALLYDVCHNIAKFEEHRVDGQIKKLCVHRKGATRAFGPEAKELNMLFQKTGQPVLVPGDMGSASYLLAGLGNPLTWSSCCHGAGRIHSRIQSMKAWKGKDLQSFMLQQGVHVMATSMNTVAEEMPDAYKNVDEVVLAVQEAKLARSVARLQPHLVIKG
ncbi:MAG: RtcB family protein [Parachlamydiales bacterium]|nr:RtcB family protein [Parachlamydiales bacterium]